MSFTGAILSALSQYATFRGRAQRAEFWWFVLFALLGNLVLFIVDGLIVGPILGYPVFSLEGAQPAESLFSLAILLPGLAVGARRMHDTGRSGWWWLINLVPVVGWGIYLYFASQPGERAINAYGPPPPAAGTPRPSRRPSRRS
ncbi:DUF805 domain-containing protein [Aurantimonas aggregata]|uniref:DUF805 domain-containing protein n=1 Tax=Aurantimonas aggregata TaxID=2047720 RepID=A0A6L9MFQ2_9HYPH|nr:DUF805 domain-containing protein [Aurantimonas aggregata]NDV86486.1 DUF805 domain-containing protein [Aurantimonas aggregata]